MHMLLHTVLLCVVGSAYASSESTYSSTAISSKRQESKENSISTSVLSSVYSSSSNSKVSSESSFISSLNSQADSSKSSVFSSNVHESSTAAYSLSSSRPGSSLRSDATSAKTVTSETSVSLLSTSAYYANRQRSSSNHVHLPESNAVPSSLYPTISVSSASNRASSLQSAKVPSSKVNPPSASRLSSLHASSVVKSSSNMKVSKSGRSSVVHSSSRMIKPSSVASSFKNSALFTSRSGTPSSNIKISATPSSSLESASAYETQQFSITPDDISPVSPAFFELLSYVSPCESDHYENPVNINVGWKNGGSSAEGWILADMVTDIKNQMANDWATPFYTSFMQRGGIICGAWFGAMVSNKDTMSSIEDTLRGYFISNGISDYRYFEYLDPNLAMNSMGIFCSTLNDPATVANAVKGWSMHKSVAESIGGFDGIASIGTLTICNNQYANRKFGDTSPDHHMGACDAVTVGSSGNPRDSCPISWDELSLYNPNVPIYSLHQGDQVCCSYGDGSSPYTPMYQCSSDTTEVAFKLTTGYRSGGSSPNDGWILADMVTDIKNQMTNDWAKPAFTSFMQRGGLTCGAYMGAMVNNLETVSSVEQDIRNDLKNYFMPSLKYYEHVDPQRNAMMVFGIACSTDSDLDSVAKIVRGWSMGTSAVESTQISGYNDFKYENLCYLDYNNRKSGNLNTDDHVGYCEEREVSSGQTASSVCGLSGDILADYNKGLDFNNLPANQFVCCSVGIQDLRPKQNADGSCYTYVIQENDSCAALESKFYPLSSDDLYNFNKNTFGWFGCDNTHPRIGDVICLSAGTPPRPSVNPFAECGPQAAGDKYNSECPLNACCSQYGMCGYGDDYCKVTYSETNAPGTTGCISNCGDVSLGPASSSWQNVAYFDGSDSSSPVTDYDSYDVIHLAFGGISSDHSSLNVDAIQTQYNNFKSMKKAKKVLSFGGQAFSTGQNTYQIFREAIGKDYANFATTVYNFMQQQENQFLDGIDFDWEFPGAQDQDGLPADDPSHGQHLLKFLIDLRGKLGDDKIISIAIPASYYYLQTYPIAEMSKYVSYFVFMTYDLHGQWDYGSDTTRCHTNYYDTLQALKMIIKAGVPGDKVRVGTANYARSYQLTSDCNGEGCDFTGPNSGAYAGKYGGVQGILTPLDISYILGNKKINSIVNDQGSQCTLLRYDDTQWAAWTINNDDRNAEYQQLGFGGSSLWLSNYVGGTTGN